MISTVYAMIGQDAVDTGYHTTTPRAWALQALLKKAADKGSKFMVIEATSHGLVQERLLGIKFDIAVLTNITHEHLDYHKTFSNYIRAKSILFNNAKLAILNKSDSSFTKINGLIDKKFKRILYDSATLDEKIKKAVLTRFKEPYNLLNATAAIITTRQLGIKDKDVIKAMETFPGVEGRMQEIDNKRGFRIIVDFAHTPNALKQVLLSLRKYREGKTRIICVFGCAGERDYLKRPLMAEISTRLADVSIFTAEDPRHEKVENIIGEMIKGVKNNKAKVYTIEDRQKAIDFAINKVAKRGDTVIICGKGHEKSMAYGYKEIPWSDVKIARNCVEKFRS